MVNNATRRSSSTPTPRVFCCPSIYEPFGIINLEAMACETAVVASAVGGIKEVVVEGETGFLVPLEQMTESPFEPTASRAVFSRDLAARINKLMADPERCARHGQSRPPARRGDLQLELHRAAGGRSLRNAGAQTPRLAKTYRKVVNALSCSAATTPVPNVAAYSQPEVQPAPI